MSIVSSELNIMTLISREKASVTVRCLLWHFPIVDNFNCSNHYSPCCAAIACFTNFWIINVLLQSTVFSLGEGWSREWEEYGSLNLRQKQGAKIIVIRSIPKKEMTNFFPFN